MKRFLPAPQGPTGEVNIETVYDPIHEKTYGALDFRTIIPRFE